MNTYNTLAWLNFFIADVQDGLGPYLGVFLKNHHFLEGQIGLIGTITSLCALLGLIVWSFSWVVFRHLAQVHF